MFHPAFSALCGICISLKVSQALHLVKTEGTTRVMRHHCSVGQQWEGPGAA